MEELIGQGKELTPEVNAAALTRFATVPLDEQTVKLIEADVLGSGNDHVQNGI